MKNTDKPVAKLQIQHPGKMLKAQRANIAYWLRKQADSLEREGENYTDGIFKASLTWDKP